jgi:hypothetical protein
MSNPNKSLTDVPKFPTVLVEARPGSEGIWMKHTGFAEDLIAAGIATADMLAPATKRGRGKGRADADGLHYWVNRYWVHPGGQGAAVRRYQVIRHGVPRDRALRLEGVREALEKHARHQEAERRRYAEWNRSDEERRIASAVVDTAVRAKHGHLRLVIDNTR